MAETSLARQLQKLAAPQTSLLKETKRRASFLFDPREAGALDTDTAFAIGTTGLEELSMLNEAFSRFEASLFAESAKYIERAVKSREENAELDNQIEEFLLLLSPHFLLRPAHKALEWLIYRFHVHQYNVDALLRCVLPFHETRVFARALQLLDLSDKTSKWHWLHCLQKPGLSLTKTALVTQCTRDPGMLKFVCELLVAMVKVHSESVVALRSAIGFYASTVLGTLEAMKRVTDQTVAMLLPFILKGLASSTTDYCAATHLVIGQLARRSVLSKEFARELVIRVAKTLKAPSLSGGLLCLLVLMTLQGIEALPKAAFQALLKHKKSLVASLEELASKHSVAPVLKPLLAQLTKSVLGAGGDEGEEASNKKAALLKALVQLALSLDSYSDFVVGCFFDTYVSLQVNTEMDDGSEPFDPTSREAVLDILKLLRQIAVFLHNVQSPTRPTTTLVWPLGAPTSPLLADTKCPEEVDACLERHLCSGDDGARLAVERLTCTSAFGREHALVESAGSALFLALNSASKRHRVAAVRELVAALQRKQDVDEKFARDSLQSRLADTEPEVVQAVLALGKDLCKFLEQGVVLGTLRRLLFEPTEQSKKWFDLRTRALVFVCDDLCSSLDEGQLLATMLPFLMPTEASEVSLARLAYASTALQRFPVLSNVNADRKITAELVTEDVDTIAELLLADLAEAAGKIDQPLAVVKMLEEACFPSSNYASAQLRCICGTLLDALASLTKDAEVFRKALLFYQRLLAEKTACGEYESTAAALREGRVPLATVVAGLGAVISRVEPVAALEESPMWILRQQDDAICATLDLLANIFGTVAEHSVSKGSSRSQFRQLMRKFFKVHCPSLKRQVHFLSGLWLLHLDASCCAVASIGCQGASPSLPKERLQSLALAVSVQLLETGEEDIKWILAEQNLVFLSIVLSLLSPVQGIRELAVSLAQAALNSSHKGRSGPHLLFNEIDQHAAEVAADTEKLLELIGTWSHGLKKQNTLLVLLNHPQVPVAMQNGILQLVAHIDSKAALEAAVKLISTTLGPEDRDVAPATPLPSSQALLLRACFAKYTTSRVTRLADAEGAVEVLEKALHSTRACEGTESVATVALQAVSKDLVKKLPKENQAKLLDTLVDLALDTPPAVQHSAVSRALRKVCFFGSLLVEPLQRTGVSQQSPARTVREAKKMRLMDASEEQDPAESPQWKRVLILLEMIQSRKSVEEVTLLVGPLYVLLKRSLELGTSPHAEYLRQCVLTALQAHGLSAPRHELASLVKCLRISQSAQAQQLVLGLLNMAALHYPVSEMHCQCSFLPA
ncbi:hypothetical protein V5799_011890 [Amblyomma americanum]|uniref:HEAT repeat-containing protein 1 n=1 Tax=Amblyomma americanum TaxID=6943 RepID=A0AAQ4EFL3_AMBAM